MADPLSILGAAAAGTQFVELAAKGLLKTIRLVKDLREVPKKLAALLQEVEQSTTRVHDISGVVLRPGSKVHGQLDQVQVGRLAQVTAELHQAMNDLDKVLTPLDFQPTGTGKTVRRLWKSVMAIAAEKDVAEKLQKVDRLNTEVSRQLEVTLLELQAGVHDRLDEASSTAKDDKTELIDTVETNRQTIEVAMQDNHTLTTTHLTDITSITSGIQQTLINTDSAIQGIHQTMTNISSTTRDAHQVVADVASATEGVHLSVINTESTTQSIHQTVTDIALTTRDVHQTMNEFRGGIMATNTDLSQLASRADIRQLRDELLAVMTGQANHISPSAQGTSRNLSTMDQIAVEESARRQLTRCPSSLADASRTFRLDGHLTMRRCRCRPIRQFTDTRFWGLAFRAEESTDHRPGCRYAKFGTRSWAYSVRAALMPFLNRTLELAIGANTRGTSWSMAPPLRFHGTVRRSESPLFQAFDRLPSLCVDDYFIYEQSHRAARLEARLKGYHYYPRLEDRLKDYHYYTYCRSDSLKLILPDYSPVDAHLGVYVNWDIKTIKCRLQDLSRQIRLHAQQGTSAGDVDEQGRTITFYFVSLVILFKEQLHMLSADFQTLFNTIIESGVDPAVQTYMESRIYGDYIFPPFDHPVTAWEYFFWQFGQDSVDVVQVSYLLDPVAAYISPGSNPSYEEDDIRTQHASWHAKLPYLEKYPEIGEGLGLSDDLEVAVLRRSLGDVERLIARNATKVDREDLNQSDDPRRPEITHLAFNWPDGLRCLVDAGNPVGKALACALYLEGQETGLALNQLSILLKSPRPIFSAEDFRLLYDQRLLGYAMGGSPCNNMIWAEFLERRIELRDLAIQHLPPDEQMQLGIDDEQMLDANAEATFYRLKQVRTVPEALDCWLSPYLMVNMDGIASTDLDRIYDAGFKSVDIPDERGYTPLMRWLALDSESVDSLSGYEALPWFLSHGANIDWTSTPDPEGTRYPTVLFYLALLCRTNRIYLDTHPGIWDAFERSFEFVPARLQQVPDDCSCFCSTGGCLAIHLLWRCNSRRCNCDAFEVGRRRPVDGRKGPQCWSDAWQLSGHQTELLYSEVTRLELFERLGMAHTCCCNSLDVDDEDRLPLYPRMCPDEEEIERMQDEDKELSLQLEGLISHYNTAREEHQGAVESFWGLWWQAVDEILPPLLPIEACKNRLMDPWVRRHDQEEFCKRDRETLDNRAAREREAMQRAGYPEPEFADFRDVIQVHFSGRDWNPEGWEHRQKNTHGEDGTDDSEWETGSTDTDSQASGSEAED